MRLAKTIILGLCLFLLASCATHRPVSVTHNLPKNLPPTSILTPQPLTTATWEKVEGWQEDSLVGVTRALRSNCMRMKGVDKWQSICAAATQLDEQDTAGIRAFFEHHFTPFQLSNRDGSTHGLITGYYEPLLQGSRTRHASYLYPLYRWPKDYTSGQKLPARGQLMKSGILSGAELVYVDDPIEAFFLQIQGSGRVVLDDGKIMRVGYNGTNGQPYQSIGRKLIEKGELTAAQTTMQGLKKWARAHPERVEDLLAVNPRFVFFKEMPSSADTDAQKIGPPGALGVPLTPERSIAVDPSAIPLGMPVFLATTQPMKNTPLNRLVFAQDVGHAIKGIVRADFFWGLGDEAGDLAGKMRQTGRMWLLLPKS